MASIESTLTNIHNAANTAEGKDTKITSVSDFLPIWDEVLREKLRKERVRTQSIEDMRKTLMAFATSHNKKEAAKVKRKNTPPILKNRK